MTFPLKELINFSGNIYEVTCASARRAFQLSKIQAPVLEEYNDKVVSVAALQIFTKEIEYHIDTHTNAPTS